jgi:hypothetical protein
MDQAQLAAQDKDDRVNRDIFEEQIDLVLDAWRPTAIERPAGGRWEIPYPYADGIEWGMREATAQHGAPGEIGRRRPRAPRERRARAVQRPAPAGLRRLATRARRPVEYCGDKGFVPTYFSGIGRRASSARPTSSTRGRAGATFALGQNQALVRWMQIADTETTGAQRDRRVRRRGLRQPLQGAHAGHAARPGRPVQSVIDCGLWMYGTPEMVRDQFVAQWAGAAGRVRRAHLPLRPDAGRRRHPQHGAVHGTRQAGARRAHRVRARGRGAA